MRTTETTSNESIRMRTTSLLKRAHQQWESNHLLSAFRLFLAAAKLGEVTAQLNLGYFYDIGLGIAKNRNKALEWYERAYHQGHGSAASNIGTIFRDEGDDGEALKWFRRAVKRHDAEANLEIAKLYLRRENQDAKALPYLNALLMKAGQRPSVSVAAAAEAQRLLNVTRK
jgi:TPR repeat protein